MLKAGELMRANIHDIRVVNVYNTRTNNEIGQTKQVIVRSINTTYKKKLGGPQIYTVKIRGKNGVPRINPDTEVQVYCNCSDFIYRRAYCLYKEGSLLIPEGFVLEPPEKTNPTCNEKICKHASYALKYLIETGK